MNCADFEGWFRGSFDFIRRPGTDVFEVFMPRSFAKGGLYSGRLANVKQIFEAESALWLEDIGFGFGMGGAMLIDKSKLVWDGYSWYFLRKEFP
jgi:hypothetical protein